MRYKNSFAPAFTCDPEILEQFPHLRGRKETPVMKRAKKVREGSGDKLCAEQVRRHERREKVVVRRNVSEADYIMVV